MFLPDFSGTDFVKKVLPFIPIFTIIALVVVVYRTQKYIRQIDMEVSEPGNYKSTGCLNIGVSLTTAILFVMMLVVPSIWR